MRDILKFQILISILVSVEKGDKTSFRGVNDDEKKISESWTFPHNKVSRSKTFLIFVNQSSLGLVRHQLDENDDVEAFAKCQTIDLPKAFLPLQLESILQAEVIKKLILCDVFRVLWFWHFPKHFESRRKVIFCQHQKKNIQQNLNHIKSLRQTRKSRAVFGWSWLAPFVVVPNVAALFSLFA